MPGLKCILLTSILLLNCMSSKLEREAQGRSTTCRAGRAGSTTSLAICAFSAVISSCSSIVSKRFAPRSIRAPIMLPSSGVSSPLPIAARMSPNASAHSPGLDSGRVLKIDRNTLPHWHGPIDEERQRRGVLLFRAGFEQGREDVGQFFGELAIEMLARRLCQFDSLRPRSTVGVRHRAMSPI